ncbi:MAG: ABC transporter permease, partial [Actinomycetota bacterium]|nr:ABC transporter permease [Actinomycetota bacterium]
MTTLDGLSPRRVGAQARMELVLLARNGESLLVTLGIPVGLLVFFSLVDVLPTGGGSAVDFLVPGILALSVMSTSLVSLAIATGFERSYLVLKRLGASPLRRGELVVAKALSVLAVEVVQVAVVLATGWALGWRPASPAWGLAAAALLLGTAAFAGIAMAMAGSLRAVVTLALANGLFVVLLLLGDLVVPLERLPGPLAQVAALLPAAPLAALLRAAVGTGGAVLQP